MLGLLAVSVMCVQCAALDRMQFPGETKQVVLVTVPALSSRTGILRTFERGVEGWRPGPVETEVNVGRAGLGWEQGSAARGESEPAKKEGDGRSPAGIFPIGEAFGYGSRAPEGVRLPYRQLGPYDFWVSDPGSPDYNRLVTLAPEQARHPEKLWSSYERMRRDDDLYRLGLVIEYNDRPAVPNRGSAIFFHIWRGPNAPTSGCTSMPEEKLLDLMRWLDPRQHPVAVELPESALRGTS